MQDKIEKIEGVLMSDDQILAVGIIKDIEALGDGTQRVEIVRRKATPIQAEIARAQAREHTIYDHRDFAAYLALNGTEKTAIFCDPFKGQAIAALDDDAEKDSEVITYTIVQSPEQKQLREIKGRQFTAREFSRLCRRLALMATTDGGAAELRLMAGQLSVSKEVTEATSAGTKGVHGRMVKIEAKAGDGVVPIPDLVKVQIKPYLDSISALDLEVFIDLVVSEVGVRFEIDIPDLDTLAARHFEEVIGALRQALPNYYAGLGSLERRDWRVVR